MMDAGAPPATPQVQVANGQAHPVAPVGLRTILYCARQPFDRNSGGDCCLLSSDGVIFYVQRGILSLASPTFALLFRHAHWPAPGCLAAFNVCDHSDVLDTLLRCIYPIRRRALHNINSAVALTLSAQRWCISPRLLPLHSFLLRDRAALLSQPITMYALAWRLGYEDATKAASRYAVLTDLTNYQIKNQIMQLSTDYEAVVALCILQKKREEHIQKIVSAIPLENMLTECIHRKRNTNHFKQLSDVVKKVFSVSDIREEDVKIKAILSRVCEDCSRQAGCRMVSTFDAYYEAVKSFPQTIEWPRDKLTLFPPDEE